jgi:hypothetical protein
MDTSWQLTWGSTSLLIDPWLLGSEVDGFSWFNEQWHAYPPVPIEALEPYSHILVSQSYSDHCHEQTLAQLDQVPVLATPKASSRLAKTLPEMQVIKLPAVSDQWLSVGELEVAFIDPHRKMDPVYYGIAVKKENEVVVYFAHGFELKGTQLSVLQKLDVKLLITSFSLYQLPAILGGAVNPGIENGSNLVRDLQPEQVVHTHDEQKVGRGIVGKLAKKEYPSKEELVAKVGTTFRYLDESYQPLEIH